MWSIGQNAKDPTVDPRAIQPLDRILGLLNSIEGYLCDPAVPTCPTLPEEVDNLHLTALPEMLHNCVGSGPRIEAAGKDHLARGDHNGLSAFRLLVLPCGRETVESTTRPLTQLSFNISKSKLDRSLSRFRSIQFSLKCSPYSDLGCMEFTLKSPLGLNSYTRSISYLLL